MFDCKRMNYQLMKELFPAEWLPIIITTIFFLGGRSRKPSVSAILTRPETQDVIKSSGLIITVTISYF